MSDWHIFRDGEPTGIIERAETAEAACDKARQFFWHDLKDSALTAALDQGA